MFIGLLVLAVVAYGLNNTLMAGLFRRHDVLTIATLRGLALLVLMAPLLLLVDPSAWQQITANAGPLAIACGGAAIANLAQATAVRHLSVGVTYAIAMVWSTLLTAGYGVLLFAERPGPWQIACAGAVLALTVVMATSSRGTGPRHGVLWRGLVACGVFGLSMSSALAGLRVVTREVSPFYAAWAWEGGIGLVLLALLVGRRVVTPIPLGLRYPVIWRTTLACSPTVVGTGAYAWATDIGDLSIAAAVIASVMISSACFAVLIYREHLRWFQWLLILFTVGAIAGLHLTG